MFCPYFGDAPSSGPLVPYCLGREVGRLASAACVHLLHQCHLVPAAETVSSLAKLPKLALGERYVRVPAATMRVAHTFEVVRQKKVADVIRHGNIDPV